jgi:hypothetical protein
MMATPNIAQLEYLFQELDFRMKSLNDVFCQEMIDIDHAVETCQKMMIVTKAEKIKRNISPSR